MTLRILTVERALRAAELLLGEGKGDDAEYEKYFKQKLEKWNVESPADIPEDRKDDFFEEVDSDWVADHEESGKDGG